MWMMPLHLHVNQKSDYDMMMMKERVNNSTECIFISFCSCRMRTRASDSVLEVKDVSLKIKDKQILHNLRCTARSGDLLAVMGPTG